MVVLSIKQIRQECIGDIDGSSSPNIRMGMTRVTSRMTGLLTVHHEDAIKPTCNSLTGAKSIQPMNLLSKNDFKLLLILNSILHTIFTFIKNVVGLGILSRAYTHPTFCCLLYCSFPTQLMSLMSTCSTIRRWRSIFWKVRGLNLVHACFQVAAPWHAHPIFVDMCSSQRTTARWDEIV